MNASSWIQSEAKIKSAHNIKFRTLVESTIISLQNFTLILIKFALICNFSAWCRSGVLDTYNFRVTHVSLKHRPLAFWLSVISTKLIVRLAYHLSFKGQGSCPTTFTIFDLILRAKIRAWLNVEEPGLGLDKT